MGPTRGMVREALSDIVTGTGVKRSKHELSHAGEDLTALFISELRREGYMPSTVADVPVGPGERVPAFYIEGTTAWFGWVFWERFTSRKSRKLWGSAVKNKRGDWQIQIPPAGNTVIYANNTQKFEMDIDRPSGF